MARRQFIVEDGEIVELAPEDFVEHPHVIFEENRWAAFSDEELDMLLNLVDGVAMKDAACMWFEIEAELDRRHNQPPKESA
jgi:hypothetical protein